MIIIIFDESKYNDIQRFQIFLLIEWNISFCLGAFYFATFKTIPNTPFPFPSAPKPNNGPSSWREQFDLVDTAKLLGAPIVQIN